MLTAVQLPDVDDATFASSIAELRRLATTLGLEVLGEVTQRRARLAPGLVLGEGKLRELAAWTGGTGEVQAYQKPGKKKSDEDEDEDEDDELAPGPRCSSELGALVAAGSPDRS